MSTVTYIQEMIDFNQPEPRQPEPLELSFSDRGIGQLDNPTPDEPLNLVELTHRSEWLLYALKKHAAASRGDGWKKAVSHGIPSVTRYRAGIESKIRVSPSMNKILGLSGFTYAYGIDSSLSPQAARKAIKSENDDFVEKYTGVGTANARKKMRKQLEAYTTSKD